MNARTPLSKVFTLQVLLILLILTQSAIVIAQTTHHIDKHIDKRVVPNQLIVKFKRGVSEREIGSINSYHGTSIIDKNPIAHFMRLKIHGKNRSVRQLVNKFRKNKNVLYAEPNYIVHTTQIPNDPDFIKLWALQNNGQTGGTPGADIAAVDAWNLVTSTNKVVVAIIDTGVDYNHQDLADNIWINMGEIPDNGVDDDANGFIDDVRGWNFSANNNDPLDNNDHGTHVAGTIAAISNNAIGMAGISQNVKIMPLKFLDANGNGTTANAVSAIQYATMMGAHISNNSWGGTGYSIAIKEAIAASNIAGTLFIAAAGNEGNNNNTLAFYPAGYDIDNIISVAATDHNDSLAAFSNYGTSTVDIGAPGVDVFSTTTNNSYRYMSGTSMAAPHTSGVAALLFSEFPDFINRDIKTRLLNAVDVTDSLKGHVSTGGRLNAYNALLGVQPPERPEPTTVFFDNIENDFNGWEVSGETSLWHQSSQRFVSSETAWYYGNEETLNYDTGSRTQGVLTSPEIDLTNITYANLSFKYFLDTENDANFDKALVRITNNGGETYTDLYATHNTSGIFVEESLNIASFDGDIIQIQFFFDSVDTLYNNYEGWYVDDIKVTGQWTEPLPNNTPTADAGQDQSHNDSNGDGSELITLNASGSFDIDGDILFYQWNYNDILFDGKIVDNNFLVGSHNITLTVTDEHGAIGTDDILLIINPNQLPIAKAGEDQLVIDVDGDNKETVILSSSGTSDVDGIISVYEWKYGEEIIGSSASILHTFSVGKHTITLKVTDNGGAIATDEVVIIVEREPLPAGSTIHISSIDILMQKRGSNYNVRSLVKIVDDTGEAVKAVVVTGQWMTENNELIKTISGKTDKKGIVYLNYGKVAAKSGDSFGITISNIFKDKFTYAANDNIETSEQEVVP